MTKAEKKAILFGVVTENKQLPLMAHWNNDSGCRLD